MPGIFRPRHPERTVLYRVLFHYFDRFLAEAAASGGTWPGGCPGPPQILPDYNRRRTHPRFCGRHSVVRTDKGQVTIRYFGLYANAHRGKVRKSKEDEHKLLLIEAECPKIPRRSWAEMIRMVLPARRGAVLRACREPRENFWESRAVSEGRD
ncbi:MAG: hypothetical protein WCC06_01050 [Candidatus Aminicenantales bacterium]